MSKVFISQPMKGKTREQIINERQAVVDQLVSEGHEVIDSVFKEGPDPSNSHQGLWFLGESFKMLSTADAIWLMDGWNEARGCYLEFMAAQYYGIEILHK